MHDGFLCFCRCLQYRHNIKKHCIGDTEDTAIQRHACLRYAVIVVINARCDMLNSYV